jgi:hypothetical protein
MSGLIAAFPDGRAVNVVRTPKEDERYADLNFAISDAFERARRQLQDEAPDARRRQASRAEIGNLPALDRLFEFLPGMA